MVIHRHWSPADHDALRDGVLAALPAPDNPPVSTPTIRMRFVDLDSYERENYVRTALNRLVDAGLAERVRVEGQTRAFWRRTQSGEEAISRGTPPTAV